MIIAINTVNLNNACIKESATNIMKNYLLAQCMSSVDITFGIRCAKTQKIVLVSMFSAQTIGAHTPPHKTITKTSKSINRLC